MGVAGGSTGSVRNLRIREDTAKYLLNLDIDSAYYDPKSRSMREDPRPEKPFQNKNYMGDNKFKSSGKDFGDFLQLQLYLWGATDLAPSHLSNSVPTQAEALFKLHKI